MNTLERPVIVGIREPRTWVKIFAEPFHQPVRSGTKRRTLRSGGKDLPLVGDLISCRRWTGQPYRSVTEVLRTGRITRSDWIAIERVRGRGVRLTEGSLVTVPGTASANGHLDAFAMADGFQSWRGMVEWFEAQYGLPFFGYLIEWEPLDA